MRKNKLHNSGDSKVVVDGMDGGNRRTQQGQRTVSISIRYPSDGMIHQGCAEVFSISPHIPHKNLSILFN